MAECLADRLADLLVGGSGGGRCAAAEQSRRHRHDQRRHAGEHEQRRHPAVIDHHIMGDRQHHELARRSARRGDAEIECAFPRVLDGAADDRQHDGKGAGAHGEPGQDPDREHRLGLGRGVGHEDQPGGVGHAGEHNHPTGTVAVGDRSGVGRGDAPHQRLEAHGERQLGEPPAEIAARRGHPQAIRHAHAHADHHHAGGAQQDQKRRLPASLSHARNTRSIVDRVIAPDRAPHPGQAANNPCPECMGVMRRKDGRRVYCERSLGSSTSRSASPNRLKPNTAIVIARPGNTAIQGALSAYSSAPPCSIRPHAGVGSWTPRPR